MLTLYRFLVTPILVILIAKESWRLLFVLVVLGVITDGLDGELARRWNVKSKLGSVLDTNGDKFFTVAQLFCYTLWHGFPWLAFVPIATRDSAISVLRLMGIVGKVTWHGKLKALTQYTLLIILPLERLKYIPYSIVLTVTIITTIVTVWSGIEYLRNRKSQKPTPF